MNFNEQSFLCHYGIKGMKWGVRRYQNKDGSLTSAGKIRYNKGLNAVNKITAGVSKATTNSSNTNSNNKVTKTQTSAVAGGGTTYADDGYDSHVFGNITLRWPKNMDGGYENAVNWMRLAFNVTPEDIASGKWEKQGRMIDMVAKLAMERGLSALTIDPDGYDPNKPQTIFKEFQNPDPGATATDNRTETNKINKKVDVNSSVSEIDKKRDDVLSLKRKHEQALKKLNESTSINSESDRARLKEKQQMFKRLLSEDDAAIKKYTQMRDKAMARRKAEDNSRIKHTSFNEYSFLCHYGIKGMKWGIRR